MRENESVVSGREIRNLLTYGTVDQPQIILPEKPQDEFIHVPNLSSVPCLSDVLPRSDGRPYAIFETPATSHHPSIAPEGTVRKASEEDISESQEDQAPEKPTVEFVIVRFSDPINTSQNLRQVERGMQRTRMFGKLLELMNRSEPQLKRRITPAYFPMYQEGGVKKTVPLKITHRVFDILRRVAFTFYADELAKERLTKDLADVEKKQAKARVERELQKEAVIEGVERVLADERFSTSGAKLKYKEMVNQTNQSASDKKEKTGEEPKADASKAEVAAGKKDEPKVKTLIEAVEDFLKMDIPSKEAAVYMEELWNRSY